MMHSYWCRWTEWIDAYMWVYVLTVTVATCRFHQPVVLVIAGHSLIAVALATVLDVSWNFQSQDIVYAATLRQDAVRPVAHWPGVVLVTGTVLGLAQRIHLGVPALIFLLAPPWEAKSCKASRWTDTLSQLYQQHHCYMTATKLSCSHLSMPSSWCGPPHSRLYRRRTWTSWWAGSHPGRAADTAVWCWARPWWIPDTPPRQPASHWAGGRTELEGLKDISKEASQ